MNIGTYFDHNNHIVFISTHTKIGTPNAKAPCYCANVTEFADLAFSNVAATFRQCLSPIVCKLSTRDKIRATVAETAQVQAHTAPYFFVTAATDQPSTADYSQTVQNYTRRVEIASGKGRA